VERLGTALQEFRDSFYVEDERELSRWIVPLA
jgi:hypothetical protein